LNPKRHSKKQQPPTYRESLGALTVYVFLDGARIVHESGAMFEIIHNKKDGKQ